MLERNQCESFDKSIKSIKQDIRLKREELTEARNNLEKGYQHGPLQKELALLQSESETQIYSSAALKDTILSTNVLEWVKEQKKMSIELQDKINQLIILEEQDLRAAKDNLISLKEIEKKKEIFDGAKLKLAKILKATAGNYYSALKGKRLILSEDERINFNGKFKGIAEIYVFNKGKNDSISFDEKIELENPDQLNFNAMYVKVNDLVEKKGSTMSNLASYFLPSSTFSEWVSLSVSTLNKCIHKIDPQGELFNLQASSPQFRGDVDWLKEAEQFEKFSVEIKNFRDRLEKIKKCVDRETKYISGDMVLQEAKDCADAMKMQRESFHNQAKKLIDETISNYVGELKGEVAEQKKFCEEAFPMLNSAIGECNNLKAKIQNIKNEKELKEAETSLKDEANKVRVFDYGKSPVYQLVRANEYIEKQAENTLSKKCLDQQNARIEKLLASDESSTQLRDLTNQFRDRHAELKEALAEKKQMLERKENELQLKLRSIDKKLRILLDENMWEVWSGQRKGCGGFSVRTAEGKVLNVPDGVGLTIKEIKEHKADSPEGIKELIQNVGNIMQKRLDKGYAFLRKPPVQALYELMSGCAPQETRRKSPTSSLFCGSSFFKPTKPSVSYDLNKLDDLTAIREKLDSIGGSLRPKTTARQVKHSRGQSIEL